MTKLRLDTEIVRRKLVPTRSQAESLIKLGKVTVDGKVIVKPGAFVTTADEINLTASERYVSRAALKLASVAGALKLNFKGMIVLDIGSSTGGFTDYALQHGAQKVIAVDVGTDQMHPVLRHDTRVELHEKTDIRSVRLQRAASNKHQTVSIEPPDLVLLDVSFISLREILPHVAKLVMPDSLIVAMVKPQFEAGNQAKHKGVIKNDRLRRDILKDFEVWVQDRYAILDKADSEVSGAKGNRERFYLLKILQRSR